jgi:hypothetical protein
MSLPRFAALIPLLAAMLFAGCESGPAPAGSAGAGAMARRSTATAETSLAAAQERPGLGTKWGEDRRSVIGTTAFVRDNASRPIARAAIYYNDRGGVEAMAQAVEPARTWPVFPERMRRLVSFALRDESGRLLPGVNAAGRWFVIGEQGRRYSIVLRNETDYRLEAVMSVDGLDVMDGQPASLGKRGYILRPRQQVVIDGWRRSMQSVAAFRFSSVRDSYAERKHGDSRNVGVIGVAIFNERGTNPLAREAQRRLKADPFPGDSGFATPP